HGDALQCGAVFGDGQFGEPVLQGREGVAVGEDGGFRDSGGAAGGAELVDVVLADVHGGLLGGGARDELFEVEGEAVVAAEADDVSGGGDVRQPRPGVVRQVGVDQHRGRLHVGEVGGEFVGGQADVDRGSDDPRLGGGEEELEELAAVGGEEGDPVSFGQAEAEQCVGEPGGAGVQVRPGPGGPPGDHHGLLVAEEPGVVANDVADQHVRTPSSGRRGNASGVPDMSTVT